MKTFLRSFLRARMAAIGLTALAGILIPVIYFLLGVSNDFSVVFQPFGEDAFQANTKDYSLVLTDRQVRINGSEWAIQLPENAGPARKGGEVWYDDLYNGIDLRFYDKGSGRAGYDLILEPGTHPDKIRLELKGEGTAYIDGNGELVLPAAEGEIRHSAPYAYQEIDGEKIPVQSKFALVSKELSLLSKYQTGEVLTFELGDYNAAYPVMIDPEISYEKNPAKARPFTNYTLNANLGTITLNCGSDHVLYDSGGPSGNYLSTDNYTATFCSDNGQPLTIQISQFLLAPASSFNFYDGSSTGAPLFSGSPYNSTNLTSFPRFTSTGTCLTIQFAANGTAPTGPGSFNGGFTMQIWCTDTPVNIAACSGSFTDPGGVSNYSVLQSTQTIICSDNGGQPVVTFSSFDTELGFDELFIYQGSGINAANLVAGSPFSGTTLPGTGGVVTGTGTCLTFFFRSEVSGTAPGWNAAISCIGGGPMGNADYTMDGGDQNTCSGLFTDSGEDVANYSNNENYTATFCSGTSEQIVFTFSEFNTELNGDLLYIYDGPTTASPQLTGSPFSGSGPTHSPGSVSSSGTCLTFVFTSNGAVTGLGWQADVSCSGDAGGAVAGPTWNGYPGGLACGSMTQLGGTVFDDFDNNGVRGARESGIRDVTVTLYDDNGQVGSPTTTDASGNYSFTGLTPLQIYRVEFTVPSIWQEGAFGSGSGTAVQFVQAGQCNANLGLLDKARYCTETNPYYIVPCYVNGSPLHASNSSSTSIARFLYNDSGNSPAASYSNWATMGTIGTVWGVAYNPESQQVYASAFLKRHAGLGPNGIGAVYRRPLSGTNTSATLFYDFGAAAGTVATNATRFPGSGNAFGQVGACGTCDNIDPTTFAQVGKVGLGSMEMSPDDKTLYVTNLYDRKVYKIDATTNSPAPGSATAIPGAPWLGNTGCSGVSRPFALKYYRGKLYVGAICDGSNSGCNPTSACNSLTATVYAYDGSTWTTVFSFPLNYYSRAYVTGSNYWVRWIDDWSVMSPYVGNVTDAQFAQPIFSAIEFDDDGSLVMGFADRTSYQLGYQAPPPPGPSSSSAERNFAHGDILRAYYNPTTQSFTLENNGVAGPLTTTNPSSTSGPGGKSFYWGDYWYGYQYGAQYMNGSGVGSMSLLPGKGEVMFSMGDPIDPYANGIAFISNTNGKSNRRLEVYQGSPSGNAPNFAKSGGLGQIVIQCAAPDIEIGNYVWWDTDLDGLMDPGEPGIPNVTLRLYLDPDGNTQGNNPSNGDEILVATTTTDAYGRYIFSKSGASNGLNTQTWQPGHTRVLTNQTYQVRINGWATDAGLTAFATGAGSPVFAMSPTQNQGPNGGQRDNNGYDNPGNAATPVLTGLSGENNHSYDFAFGPDGCTAPDLMPVATTPCVDDDLQLMANATGGVPPYTYSWTGPNGFSSTDENPVISGVTTAATGNYNLTVTDNVGCDATFVLPVVVNQIGITATPTNPSCGMNNGSIDIEVTTGGLAPFTYDWSNNALDGTEDPTGLAAGTYTVTVTDANGCSDIATVNLSGSGGPTVMISGVDPSCGASDGSINLTVSGGTPGYTFDWSDNALDGTEDPAGLSAGTYNVTVTDGASCSATASITLTSSAPPVLSEMHTDATCGATNGTIDISVTGGTGPFTFDWDDVAGTSNGEDRTGLAAGTYTVTVTDISGCTDNISVVITSSPAPTLTVDPTDETCGSSNGAVDLTVNGGTAPFTYDWDYDGAGDNDDPEDPTDLAAGTYTVTVTDANGCTATVGVTLMNFPGITSLTLVPTDATSCLQNDGGISLTVNGGTAPYAYDWDNDGEAPPDYDSEDLANLNAGTYTVTVTDANGCTITGSATVELQSGASLSTVVTDPTTCAETGSVDLTITGGVTPYTIAWSNGETTEDLTGLGPGAYTVTVTEGNGCQVTENVSIRDIREPVLNVVTTEPDCGMSNGAIDLTISDPDGTGPYTIAWSDGPATEDRTGLAPGMYTVMVTNGISCTSSLTVNLDASSAPEVTLFQTNESCTAANGAIDLEITGGTGPYTIDWDNLPGGTDPEDQTGLSAGTYNVTVTDAMGCVATGTVALTDSPVPTLSIASTPETCTGSDGTIDLTVDGIGPFTYDWSVDAYDGQEDPTGVSTGSYSVTVTDMNGCTATTTILVGLECTPNDPLGFIYCETTGDIITGGTISVTGPGAVTILADGSEGYYNFETDGTPGVYTIAYTPPAGMSLSTTNLPATGSGTGGALDPTGGSAGNPGFDNPLEIGSGSTDSLSMIDYSAGANPYYLQIEFDTGDPYVVLNNLPLENCSPCNLEISNVSVNCNNGTDFTIDFTVNWDFADLVANPDIIDVTVAGVGQVAVNANTATGSQNYTGIPVSGPGYGLLIEAGFSNRTSCLAAKEFDLVACTDPCASATTIAGGVTFQDYNNDGTNAPDEPGQENVKVEIYDCDGMLVCETWSNANGDWACTGLTPGETYRVEFSLPLQTWLEPGFEGPDNGTNVQFVQPGTCDVNFGVVNPADYCQENPDMVLTCYENGSGSGNTNGVVVSVEYNNSGATPMPTKDFNATTVGTVWGIAYQKSNSRAFTSAFLKRHSGFGPRGADGVYVFDYSVDPPALLGGFDLQGVVPSNGGPAIDLGTVNRTNVAGAISSGAAGNYQLPNSRTQPSVDLDAFGKVGKMSFGDIDIEEDESRIWLVNLYQRTLISVDLSTYSPDLANPATLPASMVRQYPILSFAGVPSCSNGDIRPFGLKFKNGRGYLGLVCDGSRSASTIQPPEQEAFVVSFDPKNPTSFSTEVQFPLNYEREPYYQQLSGANEVKARWERWMDTWSNTQVEANGIAFGSFVTAPQPLVADIEFTENGSMVIGLMDRFAHQQGWNQYRAISADRTLRNGGNAGDIILAAKSGQSFVLEQGENDTKSTPAGFKTNDGPTNAGEFFWGDFFTGFDASHHETALGSMAYRIGSGEVTAITFDPLEFNSQGISWLNTTTGAKDRAYQVVSGFITSFGKGAGLGDIELRCDPAPIQIGNYVWADTDEDGIQDACESPIPNIPVSLYNKTTGELVAVTTTDADGEYYFTNSADPDETWYNSYTGLDPNTQYAVVFGLDGNNAANNQYNPATGYLTAAGGQVYQLTAQNTGEGNNPDLNDSDGMIAGPLGQPWDGFPIIMYTTGGNGQTDHSLDAGFLPVSVSLGSTVFVDNNNDGVQNGADAGIPGVTVQLFNAANMEIPVGPDGILGTPDDAPGGMLTDAQGNYFFQGLAPGDYYVQIPASAFGTGASLENYPISSNGGAVSGGETDPDDNTDGDDEGQQPGGSGTVVTSQVITLAPSSEPLNTTTETGQGNILDDSEDANGNMTLDFGFFAPVSVGDYVWVDENEDGLQTSGEPPLAGVTVTLFNADGSPVTADAEGNPYTNTQTTDPGGNYLFENLPPGDYYVVFDISTADNADLYMFTIQNSDGNVSDGADSDASTVGPNLGQTADTGFLTSGQSDLTLDAGVKCAVDVQITTLQLTLCGNRVVDLTALGATVTPASLGAVWTTSGTGAFDGGGVWGVATTYTPSAADIASGGAVLTLTTNDPGGLPTPSACDPASDEVEIIILKVDCGTFPWTGN